MLEYLRIRNLALIEDMELEFVKGLNVLTGETGAGKSFILKALAFLTGEKLGADLVRPGEEKAVVEGIFILPDGELIIRRELSGENGRSRFFINDKLSSQDSIKELKSSLILHTSQHEQQRLLQPAFQAKLLERFCNNPSLFNEKEQLWLSLKDLNKKRQQLIEKAKHLEDKRELLEHQQKEIDKVKPEQGEEEDLENKRLALRYQEAAKEAKDDVIQLLKGYGEYPAISEQISKLMNSIEALKKFTDELDEENDLLNQAQDVFYQLESKVRKIDLTKNSEENTEDIESRLYELAQLKRKLKRSLPEILALSEEIKENLDFLDSCALDLKQLSKEEEVLAEKLYNLLQEINKLQADTAEIFTKALTNELKGLGFSEHLQLTFEFSPHELYPACGNISACIENKAHLLWIPNPGQTPKTLDKIASGGELSRFLLALVGVSVKQQQNDEQATLIFDEVDAGVGGITLNALAERIKELSQARQILLITHWPRLAIHGERHFFVQKKVVDGKTFTLCRRLDKAERHEEIIRMAGGGDEGKAMADELFKSL